VAVSLFMFRKINAIEPCPISLPPA
jgi:hypothetical protein